MVLKKITPKTFKMAQEAEQLEEITACARAAPKGETLLFPEYGAYTVPGSQKAYGELARVASQTGVTLITTLNLPSEDLPYASPNVSYNCLCIFSRHGRVYTPQAKITPQSFEMKHLDKKYPEINVTPYDFLNRVTLQQNGREYSAYFLICSDLYVLQSFTYDQLQSDALLCPANFGNGAEGPAGAVIDYAVQAGLFRQACLCNTYQEGRPGRTPLTVRVEKTFATGKSKLAYRKEAMVGIIEESSAVYPDDSDQEFINFDSMLSLTRNGTFTVPRSRSFENGLDVKIGVYENLIEL